MDIVRLPVGKRAPVDADCITIEEQAAASFSLITSALCVGVDDGESTSIVGTATYHTAEEAEAAGVVWAESVGVERLHISTATLQHPLELVRIDKAL